MQNLRRRLGPGAALLAASFALACTHGPPPQPPGQTEERRLAVPEGWLQGSALGIGPGVPLVLIHGVGGDHHLFDPQLREFRAARRVLAYDQIGCGESSDSPRGLYDLATRVGMLGTVLDAVRMDATVLLGHGEGGQVVARYARQRPSRVVGLVLLAPLSEDAEAARLASTPDDQFLAAVAQWQEGLLGGSVDTTREAVLAAARKARVPATRAMLADIVGAGLAEDVAAYPGPVLVVLAPGQTAPRGLRPEVQTFTMPAGSHWFQLDRPDALNERLREFLKPLDEAAAKRRRSG